MSRNGRHLFTSESVTEGHPDKIADQVSDSILDAILAQDPMSRVACETLTTTGLVLVAGEITTTAKIDYQDVVRKTVAEIGYTRGKYGFDAETCAVLSSIHSQSPDIAMGVDTGGAGDQGLMFGYACNETDRADAAADHARAQARARPVADAPRRHARLSASRRQVAGHRRVRRHQADPRRRRRRLEPAQPARQPGDDARGHHQEDHQDGRSRRT